MEKKIKVSLAASLVGCTLAIACLLVALSSPWHVEVTDVEGSFQTLRLEVYTHAFFWGYYCDGPACNTFTFNGKDPNGVYSWYDVCTDCDSQLTLYVATWTIALIATIALSILWILHILILWALSRGYPSKGVSLLIPLLWVIATILIFVSVLVFAVTLPSSKSNDDSQCKRFLDAFVDKTVNDSPCLSFIGEIDWDRAGNTGVVFWGPATGFVFLIFALVASPFLTILGGVVSRFIRKSVNDEFEQDYSSLSMDDGIQMDSGFVTPGL